MGPVELADSVGLDVALHVSKVLGGTTDQPGPEALQKMVDDGLLGRKSGQGFYKWENGKAVKPAHTNSKVPDDLEDRLILSMVNEAVACLDEKVVADADLLDSGKVQCTSCHDVHNTKAAADTFLLNINNIGVAGSPLCLACHAK